MLKSFLLTIQSLFWAELILIGLAILTGLFSNLIRTEGQLPLDWRPGSEGFSIGVTEIIDPDELAELMAKPGTILLDARAPLLYGAGHIPGALSLPAEELDLKLFLEGVKDKKTLIITYCSESLCPLAGRLAEALVDKGFTNVHLFSPGFDVWADLGRAVEKE
jgi:rhodanese-related sulfurtransferase